MRRLLAKIHWKPTNKTVLITVCAWLVMFSILLYSYFTDTTTVVMLYDDNDTDNYFTDTTTVVRLYDDNDTHSYFKDTTTVVRLYENNDTHSYFTDTTTVVRLCDDNDTHTNTEYLVDTPACKIPYVDPFDSSISHIVKKTGSITCKHVASLTYEDGLHLRINWTAINESQHDGVFSHCVYTPIYRPKHEPTSHNHWKYLNNSEPFNESVTISYEFVRVACYNTNKTQVYTNVHSFIPPNATLNSVLRERFTQHKREHKIEKLPNVLMIGVDSVSRLNFLRQMVNTRQLLTETLGAVDMMGYNKVGDNTFPNIVPMTLGKFLVDMPWNETQANKPFDHFNFIWKQFSKKGYVTFYAEDAPNIAIFDYVKSGFNIPPADYFNRPMSVAMEEMKDLWSNGHHCFQGRMETQIVLDNTYTFIDTFRDAPYFAFTFITRLTHDGINDAGAGDEPYYNFLKKLHNNQLLNNTVLFFYSDHGVRFGRIRETHIGKLEERLPFMFVAVPEWIKKKYMHAKDNMHINGNRLSTPFDVYETLRDILYFNVVPQHTVNNSRGVSWFQEIPIERSCDQAGILPHWCTCLRYEAINVTDKPATKASRVLLSEIVRELRDFTDICEDMSLLKIKEATRLVGSDSVLTFKKMNENVVINKQIYSGEKKKSFEHIQVVIVTSPGSAMFEATVRIDIKTDNYTVVGDISRINKYGHNADCMENFKLKKLCHCKQDLTR